MFMKWGPCRSHSCVYLRTTEFTLRALGKSYGGYLTLCITLSTLYLGNYGMLVYKGHVVFLVSRINPESQSPRSRPGFSGANRSKGICAVAAHLDVAPSGDVAGVLWDLELCKASVCIQGLGFRGLGFRGLRCRA